MSIATEITRIQTQKELLRQGLNSKGCSISQGATLEAFVTALDDIETGGGGGSVTPVQPELEYITEGRDKDYLTFKFVESGELYFSQNYSSTTICTIKYSKNGGTWNNISSAFNTYICEVSAGDEIWVQGNSGLFSTSTTNYYYFFSTAKVYISGNVNSLVNFSTGGLSDYTFYKLFQGNSKLDIDSRKGLTLPSTSVGQYSYAYMFTNCTGLTVLPTISATTLASYCYYYMFANCINITTLPANLLPATTLSSRCYGYMFNNCYGITEIPSGFLPATTLNSYCYEYMFASCYNLTTIPSNLLPATTLATYCYSFMFSNCFKLDNLPSNLMKATTLANYCCQYMFYQCKGIKNLPSTLLPATTLATACYYYMFAFCDGITEIPSGFLPATTLAGSCYMSMFYYCYNLINVPANLLPATTSQTQCYSGMFRSCISLLIAPDIKITEFTGTNYFQNMFANCINLKYIKYYSTTQPNFSGWVNEVSKYGTFYKPSGTSWTNTGTSAIPTNWTILTFTP